MLMHSCDADSLLVQADTQPHQTSCTTLVALIEAMRMFQGA